MSAGVDRDAPATRCELECIAHEIREYLEDALVIEVDDAGGCLARARELDTVGRCGWLERVVCIAQQQIHVAMRTLESQLSRFDARNIHQIADEASHPRTETLNAL